MAGRPAGQNDLRRHNAALVLETVAAAPGIARAGIADRTGLAKTTVSMLVDRLLAADVLTERTDGRSAERSAERQSRGRGRPATALALSPTGPHGLGVEIGVDHLASCLTDLTGRVRTYRTRPAANRSDPPERVLARALEAARAERAEAWADGIRVCGVSVAVPGPVEPAAGVLRVAPNLGWRNVRLPAALDDLPVSFANEADLAACAELWTGGHGPALRDFVYVSGEIGIGAGLVVDGALFPGTPHGFAGEIGHICVDPTPAGARCRCGARGCLETVAGREALLRAAGLPEGGPPEALLDRLPGPAETALEEAGRLLGTALSAVLNTLGVPAVLLGGDYAPLERRLRPALEKELSARVLASRWSPVRVLPGALGREAAARGAAQAATRATLADPESYIKRAGADGSALS